MKPMKRTITGLLVGLICLSVVPMAMAQDDKKKETAPAAKKEEVKIDAAVDAKIQSAIGQAKSGNIDSAIKALTALQDKSNGGALAAYNLGILYERKGDFPAAQKAYAKSLQQDANFSPSLLNAVRLYLRLEQVGPAQNLSRRYVNLRPDNLNHRAAELEILLYKKQYVDVEVGAKRLMRKNYQHVEAMLALADANFARGRYELTKTILTRAVALAPKRAEIFNKFGLVEMKLNNKRKAITNFKEAIKFEPTHPEANNNLGVLYHEARDYDNAIGRYQDAIKGFASYKEAYLNMGNAQKGKKQFKEAEKSFRKAMSIDANYSDAYFNLAILYLDSNIPGIDKIARLQKSVEFFKQYKTKMGSKMRKSDPANKYIAEAQKAIKDEKARQELLRQTPKGN